MSLTPSKDHYLKTIYLLSTDNEGVQITEIAKKLEVSKASKRLYNYEVFTRR